MLEITKKALTLEPQEVMELEGIIIDDDREGAFQFLKKNIYQRFVSSQEDHLKSQIMLRPGKFYAADSERGALQNEYCALTVLAEDNLRYGVVQIAGLIARRIVCWAEKGDLLATGQRYGLIRFSSRVDLYLPLQVELQVKKGDRVKAGETVIASRTMIS